MIWLNPLLRYDEFEPRAAGIKARVVAAWPELPTHKTYVVPGYFPKNGQGDYSSSGFDIGEVRNVMENTRSNRQSSERKKD